MRPAAFEIWSPGSPFALRNFLVFWISAPSCWGPQRHHRWFSFLPHSFPVCPRVPRTACKTSFKISEDEPALCIWLGMLLIKTPEFNLINLALRLQKGVQLPACRSRKQETTAVAERTQGLAQAWPPSSAVPVYDLHTLLQNAGDGGRNMMNSPRRRCLECTAMVRVKLAGVQNCSLLIAAWTAQCNWPKPNQSIP